MNVDCLHENITFPIAIVTSRFNSEVTTLLQAGALQRLKEMGFKESQITTIWVPGAIEIPLVIQRLAKQKRYSALIAQGAVIRGETTHYDYVCEQVSQGCLRVSLDENIPVVFGVLTTETEEQARARCGGSFGHKGKDAVDAAIEMVAILAELNKLQSA